MASRFIVGRLYTASVHSVLIAALLRSMHNAIVNPSGLGPTVLGVPQPDILLIMSVW